MWWAKALFREAMVSLLFLKKHYNDKHSVLQTPLPDDTVAKFFLLEVFMHIYLPQPLTDVMKFAAVLSHCAACWIDVCTYKMA